ncbi:MAG: hypothetical protein ACO2ZZ_03045 [Cyclobacteriaceae bacterium]
MKGTESPSVIKEIAGLLTSKVSELTDLPFPKVTKQNMGSSPTGPTILMKTPLLTRNTDPQLLRAGEQPLSQA